jgi:hypothetical protein
VRLRTTVRQRDVTCSAEALITVTDSLVPFHWFRGDRYTRSSRIYLRLRVWRIMALRFDATRNVVVVNNGYRDFVFASCTQALKLRYLVRLYVKELMLRNFSGFLGDQLLERMIELCSMRRTSFDSSMMGRSPHRLAGKDR